MKKQCEKGMKKAIIVESRVTMLLQRHGIGIALCTIGEVYKMAESTISKIVRIFL